MTDVPVKAGDMHWDRLEPCPFCGNADLEKLIVCIDQWDDEAWVRCRCGCRGPTVKREGPRTIRLQNKHHDILAALAWQAWQKRTATGAQP